MKIPRAPRLGLSLLFLGLLASCAVDKAALARDIDLRDVDLSTVSDGTCEAACTIDPPVMAANTSVRVKVAVVGCSCRSIEIVEPAALAGDKGFAVSGRGN